MRIFVILLISIIHVLPAMGQYRITGRVLQCADSTGVAFAEVRLPGLDSQSTDRFGRFSFTIPENKRDLYVIKGGVDKYIDVKKGDMEMLDPPDHIIRLPYNPDIQPHFQIVMCEKGSLLFLRSERMLEHVFKKRLNAAITAKTESVSHPST